jgi:SAM-dependent methyltransferase
MPVSTAATTGAFRQVSCCVCGAADYNVVRQSRISPDISLEELRSLYSASSDHVLLDQLVRCKRCDLIYVNPRIEDSILTSSYADAVDPTFVSQNPERIATFRHNLEWICRSLNIVPSRNIKILDVGCAGGAFLKAAKDLGFTPTGVEPSRWMADFARTNYGVEVIDGLLKPGLFPPGSFDIVSLWDVIEHLPEPHEVLKTLGECLKPGGLLIVNYPAVDSLAARLLGERWPFYLSVHISYYNRTTIQKQLERASFEVLRSRAHWQKLKLGYLMTRLSKYTSLGNLMGSVVRTIGLSEASFTYNMGQRLIVAKRK